MNSNNPLFLKESRSRSLVKSLIYRVLAIAGTGVIMFLITKDIEKATLITIAIHIFLTSLYYLNERVWNRINWGRQNYGK